MDKIEIGPIVDAVIRVMKEPYEAFVAKLHADGRITASEVEDLHAAIRDQRLILVDLAKEALRHPDLDPQ